MEYFAATLIGGVPWIVFFLLRKDLRKEMFIMSLITAPIGLFDLFMVPNYWIPKTLFHLPVGIEGIIYSFEIGGICSVAYAEVAHKVPIKITHYHKKFAFLVLLMILPLFFLFNALEFPNKMISLYIALLCGVALTVYLRRDLLKSALLGGFVFGFIYCASLSIWVSLFPDVKTWFTFTDLPRLFPLNIPLYEGLFGVFFAMYWGNIYELLFGYRFRNVRVKRR